MAKPNFIKLHTLKVKLNRKPSCAQGILYGFHNCSPKSNEYHPFFSYWRYVFPLLCRAWSSGFNPYNQIFLSSAKVSPPLAVLPSLFLPLIRMKRRREREKKKGEREKGGIVQHFPWTVPRWGNSGADRWGGVAKITQSVRLNSFRFSRNLCPWLCPWHHSIVS